MCLNGIGSWRHKDPGTGDHRDSILEVGGNGVGAMVDILGQWWLGLLPLVLWPDSGIILGVTWPPLFLPLSPYFPSFLFPSLTPFLPFTW